MDNLTVEERKVVDELRRRTIDELSPKALEDASLFYRFAKARDFNLEEAVAMLNKHISWRKEYQIDTILTDYEPPEVLKKYGSSSFVCFDKDGCVVRIQDWGRADSKGITSCVTKEESAKFWFYIAEKDKESMFRKNGKNMIPMTCLIYDLDEMSYSNAMHMKTLQYTLNGFKLLLDNYPESVKNINIINAPTYFAWMFAAIKRILPASVFQKLRIHATDGWKEALLNNINADDLPVYLGGNKTDPDGNPLCETIIQRGKPIPKRYYKQYEGRRLFLSSDAEKLTVKPFVSEEITFEIKQQNSYLEWEIEIKNKDIDVSLKYRGISSESLEAVELIPKRRIDSSSESEKGRFKCEKKGYYSFIFDNSYSWLHSKEVYYKVNIKHLEKNEHKE